MSCNLWRCNGFAQGSQIKMPGIPGRMHWVNIPSKRAQHICDRPPAKWSPLAVHNRTHRTPDHRLRSPIHLLVWQPPFPGNSLFLYRTARLGMLRATPYLEEIDAAVAAQTSGKLERSARLLHGNLFLGGRTRIPKTSPHFLKAGAGMDDAFDDIRSTAAPSTEPQ